MNPISSIDVQALFQQQRNQEPDVILLTDTVAAAATSIGRAAVSNKGHFLCQYITGHFWTVDDIGAGVLCDDGICHLRGQLIDAGGNKKLFNDRIPLDLFLSPGREKIDAIAGVAVQNVIAPYVVLGVTIAEASGMETPLFYPTEFRYLFSANTEIQMDMSNDSGVALRYEIAFHGVRIFN
jgi:hypothetical protein